MNRHLGYHASVLKVHLGFFDRSSRAMFMFVAVLLMLLSWTRVLFVLYVSSHLLGILTLTCTCNTRKIDIVT